jgi:hypothetical protein
MEYLMTYGWAILVIAVVLGVLYSLGIFNPSNFAPKAQPGSCQVFRPNGPGTNYDLNLEGTCSGELPEYAGRFNGNSGYVNIPYSKSINDIGNATISVWAKENPEITNLLVSLDGNSQNARQVYFEENTIWIQGAGTVYVNGNLATSGTTTVNPNKWYDIVAVFNNVPQYPNYSQIGAQCLGTGGIYCNAWALGDIANVQVYNVSFNAEGVNAIYQEGIGGVPTDLQHLVGWWPLNGNANDYSGNNNNGMPTNVIFTGTWQSGYTPP